MSDHELADGRLRARIEQLSHAELVRFAVFSITATRQGQGANALKTFADELIVRHVPLAFHGLLASVLQSPDLLCQYISAPSGMDPGPTAGLVVILQRSSSTAVL